MAMLIKIVHHAQGCDCGAKFPDELYLGVRRWEAEGVLAYTWPSATRTHQAQKTMCFKWPFMRSTMQQAAFWSDSPSIAPIISTGAPSASNIIATKSFCTPSSACRCLKTRMECWPLWETTSAMAALIKFVHHAKGCDSAAKLPAELCHNVRRYVAEAILAHTWHKLPSAARSHQAQEERCFKWPLQQLAFWSSFPSIASIVSIGARSASSIAVRRCCSRGLMPPLRKS